MAGKSKADPGPRSNAEKMQKADADAEARALIEAVRGLNRQSAEDYIRDHPPSIEVIAALAFAKRRVASRAPKKDTRRGRLRMLKSNHHFEGINEFLKLAAEDPDAESIAKEYKNDYELIATEISELTREEEEEK